MSSSSWLGMTNDEIKRYREYARNLIDQQPKQGLAAVEPLKPQFEQAKAAQQPIEIEREPVQEVKPITKEERTFPHVELLPPKFNEAAEGKTKVEFEGRNSSMVENQQPKHLNHPPEDMRKQADKEKHFSELKGEREDSIKFEADKARAIEMQQRIESTSPTQSRGMRM